MLIAPNSSPNLHSRLTTPLAFLMNWKRCVSLPPSSHCKWSSQLRPDGTQNRIWSCVQSTWDRPLKISAAQDVLLHSTTLVHSSSNEKNGTFLNNCHHFSVYVWSHLTYILSYSVLQAFHDVSLELQNTSTPLISSVIPHIDDLIWCRSTHIS